MNGHRWYWRFGLIALLVVAAASTYWIGPLRPKALEDRATHVVIVTSGADAGPGSLRDALFEAARAPGSARIRLKVAHIDLESPLPPAAQAVAIIIDSDAHTVIDAHALEGGVVIDVESPRTILRNVTVEHAAGTAFMVHSDVAELDGIAALDSDIGLSVVGDAPHIVVRGATMSRNRIGVTIAGPAVGSIHDCTFAQHTESAIWAVLPAGGKTSRAALQLADNVFTGDRDGVVLANLGAILERNHFIGSLRNAITVLGNDVTLRGNRIREAAQNGILIDSADHVTVTDNEIGRSPGTGIMIKNSSAISVDRNRIYGNAYGIVQMLDSHGAPPTLAHNLLFSQKIDGLLIIGASPVVLDNRAINNAGAGIKVLNVLHQGHVSVEAQPLLTGNSTSGNAQDGVVRGAYPL
jgi:nitrous oxidase accessory protein NosD